MTLQLDCGHLEDRQAYSNGMGVLYVVLWFTDSHVPWRLFFFLRRREF